jgi:hypothetical protein
LKEELEESSDLQPYIQTETIEYVDMTKRVACLLCSEPKETFGVYDEDLDNYEENSEDEHQSTLRKISETLGDLLEDMDIPPDTVDSLKAIFMVLDPSKV